jgi:hypothetical protein
MRRSQMLFEIGIQSKEPEFYPGSRLNGGEGGIR